MDFKKRSRIGRRICCYRARYILFLLVLISGTVFSQDQRFIAILPFSNNGSPEYSWIERGIEEILYDKLGTVEVVKLYERETILRVLKEVGIQSEADITARNAFGVGKETGVDVLISGTYAVVGGNLGIKFRAVSTYTGANVFLNTFQGPLADIFKLLEEAISQTFQAMSLRISASDQAILSHAPTTSIAAFEYYCKAYVQFQNGAAMETVAGLFNQALSLDPDFWEAQYNLGVIYFNYDQYGRALSQFEKVINQNPNFYKPYYGMGMIYFLQRNYSQALQSYQRVLQLSPDHDRALYYLGRIYVRMDSVEKGLEYLNKSAELNPNYPPTHYHIGMANMERGWYKSAVQAFKNTIKLDPENYLAHNYLGECFYRLQRFDEAIFEYQRATSLKIDFSTAYFNIGNTHYKRGALQDIVDSYLEILETRYSRESDNNQSTSLAKELRSLRTDTNDQSATVYREMVKAYRSAVKYEPGFFEAAFNLALTYENMAMADSAKFYYQYTIAVNPKLVRAHMRLGRYFEREGNYQKALEQFKEVVKIEPSYFAFTPRLGEPYRYINIIDEVLSEYQTRQQVKPNDPETLIVLARIFNSLGRYGQAEQYYQQIVQLDPLNGEANRELKNLRKQQKQM
jgi:tetratricopeptide (TPR) repeat protein